MTAPFDQPRAAPLSLDVPPNAASERMNTWPPSAAVRAEHLIAVARTVLAVFALLTIWIAPREPTKHTDVTYALLASYAAYSFVMLVVVWISHAALKPLRLITHIVDLCLYPVFSYLTEGVTSPVFAYLVFCILCGAIRWRWRGALATAAAAIAAFVGLGFYADRVLKDPTFQLDRFIFRAVYLAVIAGIVTFLGAYEEQVRRELRRLADWPRLVPADTGELVRQLLGHAADVLSASRLLMVWDEPDEPWRHVALWSPSEFHLRRDPPARYSPLVADQLRNVPFVCREPGSDGRALFAAGEGLHEWRGQCINADLVADFGVTSVLALPLPGARLSGWLFCLDKRRLSYDDIALGMISARAIIASLDHAELVGRLRETALTDERGRLSRDLHDGLLQSLTAARLQLHQLKRHVSGAGVDVEQKLDAVETVMSANQRDLRLLVEQLRPHRILGERQVNLVEAVEQLRQRMQQEWSLSVHARVDEELRVPSNIGREACLMINEALVNAARHGRATAVDLRVAENGGRVAISVSDNGRGFAFQGRRDQFELAREGLGPVSLRERILSLNGTLIVDSSSAGARVELTIPIGEGA